MANGTCKLLALPAELRTYIYELVFGPHTHHMRTFAYVTPTYRRELLPPVLRVNRQMRRETLGPFFSRCVFMLSAGNTSCAHWTTQSQAWLQAIGPHARLMRNVEFFTQGLDRSNGVYIAVSVERYNIIVFSYGSPVAVNGLESRLIKQSIRLLGWYFAPERSIYVHGCSMARVLAEMQRKPKSCGNSGGDF